MLEDSTLREVFHIRVTLLGAISVITLTIIAIIALLSVLIVYTPIRNILPGYSASLRQQLTAESARVDSLQADLTIQRQYLDVIKQLAAGDIKSDTVQSLDSLQRVERAQIAELHNEATDAFMAQYEQKERDRMMLYDAATQQTVPVLYRPVHGVVTQSARPDLSAYGTQIRTPKNEQVLATARGYVTLVERDNDGYFTIVLQHKQYMTVYRHVWRVLKQPGVMVEGGESIGIMDGEKELELSLWDTGTFVNSEDVIAW